MARQNVTLWDMTGVDSLTAAKTLFGESVGKLAPFQSLEAEISVDGRPAACSILRLCEHNFRVAAPAAFDRAIALLEANVWIRSYTWLSTLFLPAERLPDLTERATVRPPHRLANRPGSVLPNHRAVPAQLGCVPVLIWQHPVGGEPAVEIHAAIRDIGHLAEILE